MTPEDLEEAIASVKEATEFQFGAMQAQMNARFDAMEARTSARFDQVDGRFDYIEYALKPW